MKPLTLGNLLSLDEYERIRQDFRRRIIALKERRRISVGDMVTLVFENRETILFQVQEMLRAERIVLPDRVREEVETYNEQIPAAGELSATLLIEVTDAAKVKPVMDLFQGIDRGRTVAVRVGAQAIYGVFEQGRSHEDKISAVHYVRFAVPATVKAQMQDSAVPMELVIDHPGYQARAPIPGALRDSLLEDLNAE